MMVFYLSTDLQSWQPTPDLLSVLPAGQDIEIEGRIYRPCTPTYYAYLRRQMEKVRTAHTQGSIHAQTYQPLAQRFNTLHAAAASHFGERALADAVRTFDARR